MKILEVRDLYKVFNQGKHSEVDAVNNVSIEVNKGEIVMLIGPSGSGKTTLLTMLGGLLKPTSGEIKIHSIDIGKLNNRGLTKIKREKIGFVFQSFNLLENLSAVENVMIAAFKVKNAKVRSRELLIKLGLEKRVNALPKELSGGERQRVAIARAIINNPEIIFADEPTANLDKASGRGVMNVLCSIACEQGSSLIIVSHDERIQDIAHRVIHIEDGRLVREESGLHNRSCKIKPPRKLEGDRVHSK